MSKCFVIQPFDGGKFDKRFRDTIAPAIKEAGLAPYRVDQDPNVEVPIDAVEEGIRESVICVADISTDNPNVWYELGYAFASGKAVVMLCSDERVGTRYPFDIQHRTIVSYQSESSSDFLKLKKQVKERIEALLKKSERLREIAHSDPVATLEGLSQPELAVLATLAGDSALPGSATSLYSLKHDVERVGFTSVGFGLGLRRLIRKNLIETVDIESDNGDTYPGTRPTEAGWQWIEDNEKMFSLKTVNDQGFDDDLDDDIPF